MPKGIRINSVQPYTTISPRRALHPTNSPDGILHGKVVRQAGNPNCDLPQRISGNRADRCGERRSDGTIRALTGPTAWLRNDTDPDWAPASLKSCARLACETGLDIKGEYYDQDTRCAVANPPQYWTLRSQFYKFVVTAYPNVTDSSGSFGAYNPENIGNLFDTTQGWIFEDGNISPTIWWDPLRLSSVNAQQFDVPRNKCMAGETNPMVAKQIQCDLGLRPGCPNPTSSSSVIPSQATSAAINILPTIDPAVPIVTPTKHHDGAQLSTSAVIAGAASSLASAAASLLAPTPTATIAASAPSYVVGALSAAIGVSGAVGAIGIASYAGYKLVNYLNDHPFKNGGHSLEEAQKMIDEAIEIEMQPVSATEPRYTEVPEAERIYETVEQTKKENQ